MPSIEYISWTVRVRPIVKKKLEEISTYVSIPQNVSNFIYKKIRHPVD
jgi:hypothetical protein